MVAELLPQVRSGWGPARRRDHVAERTPRLHAVGREVGLVDGTGVTTEDGDEVGVTVGCGVLVLDAGLDGVIRTVGVGVTADRDGERPDLAGAVNRADGGEKVAWRSGLTSR